MNILSLNGVQDKYLHYKAFHSFFVNRHVTYEPFSKEHVSVNAQGQADYSRQVTFNIPAAGELMCKTELETVHSGLTNNGGQQRIAFIYNLGIYQLEYIECKAVQQTIDTLYPEFIDALSRLTVSASQRACYNDLIGQINIYQQLNNVGVAVDLISKAENQVPSLAAANKDSVRTLLPIPFWFTQDYSQSFPISILIYTQITFRIKFRAASGIYYTSDGVALTVAPTIIDCKLWIEYVYLDENARKRLVNEPIFFVIQQSQTSGQMTVSTLTYNYKLPFTMPVFELMALVREVGMEAQTLRRYDFWDRYAGNANMVPDSPFEEIEIKYNSNKIMDKRGVLYHSRLRPFYDHTTSPDTHGLWIHTHALFPEKVQASGTANLSGSDNNYINFKFNAEGGHGIGTDVTGNMFVFARNINYLYLESGYITILFG